MVSFETLGFGTKISIIVIVLHIILLVSLFYLFRTKKLKTKQKRKIIKIFLVSYLGILILLSPFIFMYFKTHVHVSGIVPPVLYVRLLDKNNNPIRNSLCYADIQTIKGYEENKLLEEIEIMRELKCYGREECNIKDYLGYYRLNITDISYKKFKWLFFSFWEFNNTIEGEFEIKVVCMHPTSVAYFIFNETNFPCSPIPLEGNYRTPSFYCSDNSELIREHAYEMGESEFDEYDTKAMEFLKENYQGKVILSNNKLAIAMDNCDPYEAYSCGLKPVGIIQDKKGYGDPYVFTEFMFFNCERRLKLINEFDIDLVLSRFELDKCDFMKEVYNEKDYIYEIKG